MLRHLHKQAKHELHNQELKKKMAAADNEVRIYVNVPYIVRLQFKAHWITDRNRFSREYCCELFGFWLLYLLRALLCDKTCLYGDMLGIVSFRI